MTIRNILIIILIILGISTPIKSQTRPPKIIKFKGEYIHKGTNTKFPNSIDNCSLKHIYSYDRKKNNIGASYELVNQNGKTLITVYLYPAEEAIDYRLRQEYSNCVYEISNIYNSDVQAIQYYVNYSNDRFKVNGYRAWFDTLKSSMSVLELYECGKWFFKIRITSNNIDSIGIENLRNKVLDYFKPTEFVKNYPLKLKPVIYYDEAALMDSATFYCFSGCALKKLIWAKNNIDTLEREAGFPDLYLQLHIELINDFLDYENKCKYKKYPSLVEYAKDLRAIQEAGYIKEFLMEQYGHIMIVPENTMFDFKGYKEWIKNYSRKVELKNYYYVSYVE